MEDEYPYNLFKTNKNISYTKLNDIYSSNYNKSSRKVSILSDYKNDINDFIAKHKLDKEQLQKIKILENISKNYYEKVINNTNKNDIDKDIEIYYKELIFFKDIITKNKLYIKHFNTILQNLNNKSIKTYNDKLLFTNPFNIEKLELNDFDKHFYFKKINSVNTKNNFKKSLDILTQGNNINLSIPSIGLIDNIFYVEKDNSSVPSYINFISRIINIKEINYKTNEYISAIIPFKILDLDSVLSKLLLSTSDKNNNNSVKKILKNMITRISIDLNDIFYITTKNNNKITKKIKNEYIIPYKFDNKGELIYLSKIDFEKYRDAKILLKLNNELIIKVIKNTFNVHNDEKGKKDLEKRNYKNILACYMFYIINLTYDILKNYLDKIDNTIKDIALAKNTIFGILNIKDAYQFTSSLKMALYKFKLILLNNFYYLFIPANILSGNYGMELDEYSCFVVLSTILNDTNAIYEKYPFRDSTKDGLEETIIVDKILLKKFILNTNSKNDIYNSKFLLEFGGMSFNYSITKKACTFLSNYYVILEKSNIFDIFIIDIIINKKNKDKKIPIELINTLNSEILILKNDLSKDEKYDLEIKIYSIFDNLMEKSTNYWNKINNLKKKGLKHKNNETIFLLCFNTFFIKAESILRIIKYKINDIGLKNTLIEKCLKRKKYYEEIIKKNI